MTERMSRGRADGRTGLEFLHGILASRSDNDVQEVYPRTDENAFLEILLLFFLPLLNNPAH